MKSVTDWERNVITFRAEVPWHLLTPEQKAREKYLWEAHQREQRRLINRWRRLRRFVRYRLRDTWNVLRHGLPERDW